MKLENIINVNISERKTQDFKEAINPNFNLYQTVWINYFNYYEKIPIKNY